MKVGFSTDTGNVRLINQDSLFVSNFHDAFPLFIVADGMGGHNAGEVASKLAVRKVEEIFKEKYATFSKTEDVKETIKNSFVEANNYICEQARLDSNLFGMGTTLTLGFLFKNIFIIGHVGDSRAYLIRNNSIKQLTEDHSLVRKLVLEGRITETEAENHPQKNIITRAVGTDDNVEVDIIEIKVTAGDIIFICSDGLTNMVRKDKLFEIFTNTNDIQIACDECVKLAKANGGYDNITVIGIRF
ncbi:MAG TPA: Stp1/IreP family PP2C-type Ser/Thr phosphatase [Soehngenia sp.]|nr:Stp1/IreP family PP2C-type Ser/Thr phosphatase [Soehngenia sp.]HPP31535.1 Stp1/IreP family PP2C-type Ser/Thr phosphatase [Soehngenia sp.]